MTTGVSKPEKVHFTVDAHLLQELGERLVGQPHIALGELIKNAYDADATVVQLDIGENSIVVSDNGHGMTEAEFRGRWMRVGSTHKASDATSKKYRRPLTGSKGIGRLSAQFLGDHLNLVTVPEEDDPVQFTSDVDWTQAVRAGNLTSATATLQTARPPTKSFPDDESHGVQLTISNLQHTWDANRLESLARQIWYLQPPVKTHAAERTSGDPGIEILLTTIDPEAAKIFATQMSRILDIWSSRIIGRLKTDSDGNRSVQISVQLEDYGSESYEYSLAGDSAFIDKLDFDIRIFDLRNRQPFGIRVDEARDYLNDHGGVHIFDAGFRIPYSGPEADWLGLEIAHSHRLSLSKLLPDELQVSEGLTYLPTNSRVFGVVNVNTGHERSTWGNKPHLVLQVSRDRLVANEANEQLRNAVRTSLDYYAHRLAAQKFRQIREFDHVLPPAQAATGVLRVLDEAGDSIPPAYASRIRSEVEATIQAVHKESEQLRYSTGLLASLATVGMFALAYDHQVTKQLSAIEKLINDFSFMGRAETGQSLELRRTIEAIEREIRLARQTHRLFAPLREESARSVRTRYRASTLIQESIAPVRALEPWIDYDVSEVDDEIRLPEGTQAEWAAIFQNVLFNATNAVAETEKKEISISSFASGNHRGLRIQDTGVGVDLDHAGVLFEPFKRGIEISQERRDAGLGGNGLGLTIVRTIATSVDCNVRFVQPDIGFSTCFEISWREAQ